MKELGGIAPELGRLIEAYISDESLFSALETHLIQTYSQKPHLRHIWDLVVHAINHYDIDASIRASEKGFSDLAVNRLRALADALMSGSSADVELAARRYLGARLPGA